MARASANVAIVIPNWNGRRWLPSCLQAVNDQSVRPREVIVVDNGSCDGSVGYLGDCHPHVKVVALSRNTGFAHAANVGIRAASGELVALVNTDVVLAGDWLARMSSALQADPRAAAVASKMLALEDPQRIYDAGDVLRRDGACEQRGRGERDRGQFDQAGEVFGACAGAALYRRQAVVSVGGFDERYFAYLEDVDLALALRLDGWTCRYEPAVALHAGEGSSGQLPGGHLALVQRNTLLLVAKAYPARWLPLVAYRQAAWAWHAARERRLASHLLATAAVLPMLPGALQARRRLQRGGGAAGVAAAVPARPIRGPAAGGHPARIAASWR